jgi:hypothetical protein
MPGLVIPQVVSISPVQSRYIRGPGGVEKTFMFELDRTINQDPKGLFLVNLDVYISAYVVTTSGNSGKVSYIFDIDGRRKNRGIVEGNFDPDEFPPHQPLVFAEKKDFEINGLQGKHVFNLKPGPRSRFDARTFFEIHLQVRSCKPI